MKKIIVLIIIGIGIFILYQKISNKSHEIELLYDKPYIVVYGKDSCGSTQKCLKDLENTDFKYQYKNLDNKAVGDELHPRMRKAGLDTKYYLIPVVDINGKILIRPTIEEISSIYNSN